MRLDAHTCPTCYATKGNLDATTSGFQNEPPTISARIAAEPVRAAILIFCLLSALIIVTITTLALAGIMNIHAAGELSQKQLDGLSRSLDMIRR